MIPVRRNEKEGVSKTEVIFCFDFTFALSDINYKKFISDSA